MPRIVALVLLALSVAACGNSPNHPPDACSSGCADVVDASAQDVSDGGLPHDVGASDVAASDGAPDSTPLDAAVDVREAGTSDVSVDTPSDAGTDVTGDVGVTDAAVDSGTPDVATESGTPDVATDTGTPDVASDTGTTRGCVSGATGTLAVRFQWTGTGSGSTATVLYLENDLPDTSRWNVSANDMSFSYTPIFDDTFLGAGGLDLEGTAFMDVALSTVGLSSISHVTIAIFGRSFDTVADGSYSWQTFTDVGATPTDFVSNVAPYQWYLADATTAFVAGDSGVLLRIRPGPTSNALIVNTVEICFDAM